MSHGEGGILPTPSKARLGDGALSQVVLVDGSVRRVISGWTATAQMWKDARIGNTFLELRDPSSKMTFFVNPDHVVLIERAS